MDCDVTGRAPVLYRSCVHRIDSGVIVTSRALVFVARFGEHAVASYTAFVDDRPQRSDLKIPESVFLIADVSRCLRRKLLNGLGKT